MGTFIRVVIPQQKLNIGFLSSKLEKFSSSGSYKTMSPKKEFLGKFFIIMALKGENLYLRY